MTKCYPLVSTAVVAFLLASPTMAATPAASSADAEPGDIRVVGHPDPEGLLPDQTAPKSVSAISTDFIVKQAPTLNAFQLVNLLPGANVSSTDPYGLSVSSSLTLRGLGQDEIGVLMEGAPQNDIGYYYAYPAQFADAENVRQVTLSQGAVDIDSPVVGTAGGLLSLSLDDPKSRTGGLVDLSLGSYDEARAFVRFDTGTIGRTGLKAFISYSFNRADNWRGAGFDMRQHVDAKLLNEWGDGNRASLAVSFNDADTSSYPSPTLADWQANGRGFNFDRTYTDGDTSYWRLYRDPFRNIYVSAPVHLKLNDRLGFDSTAYLQFGYGNSPYGTQLATTGNYLGTELLAQPIALPGAESGVATVLGNYTGQQFRGGDVAKLTYQAGAQHLTAGLWFDYGTDHDIQSYTSIGADGVPGAPLQVLDTPPKAHSILPDPENRAVYAAVLGADAILHQGFDPASGRLSTPATPVVHTAPGAGPRHFRFARDGALFYCTNELAGTLNVYARDRATGALTELQSVLVVPPAAPGVTLAAADLHLTPDERFLYASERTNNVLAGFRLRPDGTLDALGTVPAEAGPRGFAINPRGSWLLCAGQQTGRVAVYGINVASGALIRRADYAAGSNPTWIEIIDLPPLAATPAATP